jgi:hypothetical protein
MSLIVIPLARPEIPPQRRKSKVVATQRQMSYYHGTQALVARNYTQSGFPPPDRYIYPGYPPKTYTLDPDGLVFFSDSIEQACFWGCEGEGEGSHTDCHVYEVIPTGPVEPDRSVRTGQVPEGNFQSGFPLRIVRAVT